MLLRSVEYLRPATLADAVKALEDEEGARVLAGGQSLLNVLKHRAAAVDLLVDISRLEELRAITVAPDGGAEIGAAATYDEIDRHAELRAAQPKVSEVANGLVDQQVRCRGTIGGNACYNDPGSNYPPLLVALGATMRVTGADGDRDVPAEDFFLSSYRVGLRRGELLHSIVLPPLGDAGVGYSSLQIARDGWAVARAAVHVRANGTIQDARVVLGCVAGRPVRATAVEERLRGAEPTRESVQAASESAAEGIDPPSDSHASTGYRRDMTRVVVRRAVLEATGQEG
jgi:aerobic carbon-monoxide dehydrogenase medium subunit